jgi:alpha-tubulin suppressor-like RCC1 family protein
MRTLLVNDAFRKRNFVTKHAKVTRSKKFIADGVFAWKYPFSGHLNVYFMRSPMNRSSFLRLLPACMRRFASLRILSVAAFAMLVAALSSPAMAQRYVSISAGVSHACGLLEVGRVQCWGSNTNGRLGVPSVTRSSTPIPVEGIGAARTVSAGTFGTCAVMLDATVRCWGSGGILGNGSSSSSDVPVTVTGLVDAVDVAVGSFHACALRSNGTAVCWGGNSNGQLGNGTTTGSSVPVTVTGITNAQSISAGGSTSCVARTTGEVRCWGNNFAGLLGDGTTVNALSSVSAIGITAATQVSTGGNHTCARLSTGELRCWGGGLSGQLGGSSFTGGSLIPIAVSGIANAARVSAGTDHSCALLNDGSVKCWGGAAVGQLGLGSLNVNQNTPQPVPGLTDVVMISTGQFFTCAVVAVGTPLCWGINRDAQLGVGANANSGGPVTVFELSSAGSVAAGRGHACASQTVSGAVFCWGANDSGQLSDGTTRDSTIPVAAVGLAPVTSLSAGRAHTCARMGDLSVRCWGNDGNGQLGNGSGIGSVVGITNASIVAAGDFHSCASLADGTVKCWGDNFTGQLGNGTTTGASAPVVVSGVSTATDVSAGGEHSCSRLSTGAVVCWGRNTSGQIGDGTSGTDRLLPVFVSGISNAASVAAGSSHSCARLTTGSIQCWGSGANGQLGNGSFSSSLIPVTVTGISTATSVSAGDRHACARLSNSTVKCWGDNNSGQLGDDTTALNSNVPVTVQGITNATSVSAGTGFSCARLSTGAVKCWGSNAGGRLGDGLGALNSFVPQPVSGGLVCSLDVDGDGVVGATTDLLILSRVRMGLTGDSVTANALGPRATRTTWTAIRNYLRFNCGMGDLAP